MFSRKTVLVLIVAFIAAIYFFYAQNHQLVENNHTIEVEHLPLEHDGITMVHLSDLHSAEFGDRNERLLNMVNAQSPDMIFMTGDLIDSYTSNQGEGVQLMEDLVEIAPTYYVTGNHEWRLDLVDELSETLTNLGVHVLRNEAVNVVVDDFTFQLVGIDDPDRSPNADPIDVTASSLQEANVSASQELYTVLLAHRPEMFSTYQEANLDLVLSGHAHGGQIRLPLIGGILAPGQGLFPDYSEGMYEEQDTKMIVSRGLGNSLFPLRVFNRPEVIRIDLIPPPA
ncbi:metallophosphoesterase [Shouchella sp. JSM 1781072]|uniref:metallophosphoesterase n=1 Tax=Bacillaceae TaxID=186817 RepID=UPI000C08CC0F|nr:MULTISPECIES: metallophosphoesterase [Bacillaceae]UTR05648.1 metallophosphoesterase [Alkalihalobacillus sp. LMS6]